MDNAYYAVRPDLVLLAKTLFHIRPSTLDAGEKRLLLRAQAITDGREDDRWGHHVASVVQRFCAYTQDANGVLPWQELLEDEARYDGVEGVAARTGNRPLGTTRRYQVQTEALAAQLQSEAVSAADCAQLLAVPQPFIEALLDGRWPSVSEFMAEQLRARWGQEIVSRAEVSAGAASAATDHDEVAAPPRPTMLAGVGLAVVFVGWLFWGMDSSPTTPPASEAEIVGLGL